MVSFVLFPEVSTSVTSRETREECRVVYATLIERPRTTRLRVFRFHTASLDLCADGEQWPWNTFGCCNSDLSSISPGPGYSKPRMTEENALFHSKMHVSRTGPMLPQCDQESRTENSFTDFWLHAARFAHLSCAPRANATTVGWDWHTKAHVNAQRQRPSSNARVHQRACFLHGANCPVQTQNKYAPIT